MFKYDDYDYESLLNDPAVDPDSADALYALAQFCRTGKGCPASEVAYQKYLQRAADEGNAQAKAELDAAAVQKPMLDTVDISALSLGELIAAADDGKADALVPAARRALELNDTARAVRYFKQALDFMSTGAYVYTDEEAQDICMTLAHIMESDAYNDEKAATHYYGMAQELGSVEAARILELRYRTGTGAAQDNAQADAYGLIAARNGNAVDKLSGAVSLMEHGKNVDAALLLEEAAKAAPDTDTANIVALMQVQLGQRKATPELLDWAWNTLYLSVEDTFKVVFRLDMPENIKQACVKALFEKIYDCRHSTPEDAMDAGLSMKFGRAFIIMCYLDNDTVAEFPWARYCVQNIAEAGELFKAPALYTCGYCYLYALGTPQDIPQAIAYLKEAAELDYFPAQDQLGKLYLHGTCVEQDTEKGVDLLTKSANHGSNTAIRELWLYYFSEGDWNNAVQWLTKGVQAGSGLCARILGEGCVYDSDVGEEDYRKGLEWYNKAVELGDPYALVEIGSCYLNGWGVPKDQEKALSYFLQAAEKNLVAGCARAAWCYLEGIGTKKDYKRGHELLQRAIALAEDSAHPHARVYIKATQAWLPLDDDTGAFAYSLLGKVYFLGEGVVSNYEKARACYERACELGDEDGYAAFSMYMLYKEGKDGVVDYNTAMQYLQKAKDAGNQNAIEEYKSLKAKDVLGKYMPPTKEDETEKAAKMERSLKIYEKWSGILKKYLLPAVIYLVVYSIFLVHLAKVPVLGTLLRLLFAISAYGGGIICMAWAVVAFFGMPCKMTEVEREYKRRKKAKK